MAFADVTDKVEQRTGMNLNSVAQSPGGNYGSSKGPSSGSKIYMGPGSGGSSYIGEAISEPMRRRMEAESNSLSYGQAQGLPLQWLSTNPNKLRDFVNTGVLRKLPGFSVNMGMPEILAAWDKLLATSWGINQMGATDRPWSPWDVMNSYSNSGMNFGTVRRGDWLYDVGTGEKVKYVGPKSKTTTQKRIDLSSPEDVKALTTQMLSELLGRAPTAEELGKYKSAINAYEQSNPMIATTTETLNDMGEVVSTSTKTEGGASEAAKSMVVAEQAKQGPEYGKYQSGTMYWGAMMDLLGG